MFLTRLILPLLMSSPSSSELCDCRINILRFFLFIFPESERGERERKGDLDHYERVDGDRNQTSKFLAVKKVSLPFSYQLILKFYLKMSYARLPVHSDDYLYICL